MKLNKSLIASVIVGGISLVLGFIFIGIVVQTVTNSQLSTTTGNWGAYAAAYSLITLVSLFNALLMIIIAVVISIGFLKAVGLV